LLSDRERASVFRYVAFAWNDADPTAREGARVLAERLQSGSAGWLHVLERNGLDVFCWDVRPGASEPYLLHNDAGVVLGKLFAIGSDGSSAGAPLALSEQETSAVLTSAGRRLVERYWGRYVAFLQDGGAGTTWVLRDPTGTLPCFTARFLGVDVYFSHMEEGAQLGGRAFSVNWSYVAATLCQSRVQVHSTGLNEVSQVLGGECIELRGGRTSRQFYWNPLRIAEASAIDDPGDAARLLRDRTRDCVHAWASSYRGIVHLLSGGLDSSIVLACLKDAPARPQMTCLNFHSPGSNTDERAYARLAAQGTGCEVVERPRNSAVTLRSLLDIQKSCIPADYFFYLDGGRSEAQVAADHQATAVFSGYGGDQLFYQARARFAAGDYLSRHGVGPALFTVALDAARVDRVSVWSVLREAVMHGLLRRRWSLQSDSGRYNALIRDEVVRDISRDVSLVHPWFHTPGRAPSGKLWHAYQLLFPMDFYNPLGSAADPETVTPLFSQPLLELAMRIPTWLLTIGGWDRAMARRAFQHEVPRPIITRRTKGGQEEHAKAILMRDIGFARELLLDGQLVRERILDRTRVAEVLSGRPSRAVAGNAELYGCLSAEAWLRQWQPG
jgi:asparagine synthase (glutamine-hydrolysing)